MPLKLPESKYAVAAVSYFIIFKLWPSKCMCHWYSIANAINSLLIGLLESKYAVALVSFHIILKLWP
jgi:hypothetical protein